MLSLAPPPQLLLLAAESQDWHPPLLFGSIGNGGGRAWRRGGGRRRRRRRGRHCCSRRRCRQGCLSGNGARGPYLKSRFSRNSLALPIHLSRFPVLLTTIPPAQIRWSSLPVVHDESAGGRGGRCAAVCGGRRTTAAGGRGEFTQPLSGTLLHSGHTVQDPVEIQLGQSSSQKKVQNIR